jgi:hypothetical protein
LNRHNLKLLETRSPAGFYADIDAKHSTVRKARMYHQLGIWCGWQYQGKAEGQSKGTAGALQLCQSASSRQGLNCQSFQLSVHIPFPASIAVLNSNPHSMCPHPTHWHLHGRCMSQTKPTAHGEANMYKLVQHYVMLSTDRSPVVTHQHICTCTTRYFSTYTATTRGAILHSLSAHTVWER